MSAIYRTIGDNIDESLKDVYDRVENKISLVDNYVCSVSGNSSNSSYIPVSEREASDYFLSLLSTRESLLEFEERLDKTLELCNELKKYIVKLKVAGKVVLFDITNIYNLSGEPYIVADLMNVTKWTHDTEYNLGALNKGNVAITNMERAERELRNSNVRIDIRGVNLMRQTPDFKRYIVSLFFNFGSKYVIVNGNQLKDMIYNECMSVYRSEVSNDILEDKRIHDEFEGICSISMTDEMYYRLQLLDTLAYSKVSRELKGIYSSDKFIPFVKKSNVNIRNFNNALDKIKNYLHIEYVTPSDKEHCLSLVRKFIAECAEVMCKENIIESTEDVEVTSKKRIVNIETTENFVRLNKKLKDLAKNLDKYMNSVNA
jgi:hypothetical protein